MVDCKIVLSSFYKPKRIFDLANKLGLIYMIDYYVDLGNFVTIEIYDMYGSRKNEKTNFITDLNEGI